MKLLVAAITIIAIPSVAMACMPLPPIFTDSEAPVTYKISDTYFEIPEKYLGSKSQRFPRKSDIAVLAIPTHGILSDDPPNSNVWITADDKHVQVYAIQLNEKIKISTKSPLPASGDFSHDELLKFIKSISSDKEPASWARDIELVEKLGIVANPCDLWNRQLKGEKIKPRPEITYKDFIDSLHHRNEEIRIAAAGRIDKFFDKGDKDELLADLFNILVNDKSDQVRSAAASGLSKYDNEIAVERMLPLIKPDEFHNYYKEVAQELIYIIRNEVREKQLTSPEQLSPHSASALKSVIIVLKHMKNDKRGSNLISSLREGKEAIATKEYIAALNEILTSGEGSMVGEAAISLGSLRKAGISSLPEIIKRMENSSEPEELHGLIASIKYFGMEGLKAVPALIKLSSLGFDKARSRYSRDKAGIRTAAVRMLDQMGAESAEVKAAFEAATKDTLGAKREAENALEKF